MQGLTARQQQVLDYIQVTHRSMGVAPSLREIAQEFGFRSMTAAADHVRALRRKGYLTHHPRRARAHAVPSVAGVPPAVRANVISVPLYSTAPAAEPENGEGIAAGSIVLDLDALGIARSQTLFAIQVQGHVMAGSLVREGDIAILDWGVTPVEGDVVAVKNGQEYVLQQFARVDHGLGTKSVAPNGSGDRPADALVAQGVMVGLIRRYR